MEREGGFEGNSRQSFSSIMWEDTTIKEEVTTPNCLDDSSFVNTDHLQEGYNGMMRFHSHHPLEKNMESIITSYERQGGLVDSSSHSSYMVMPSFTNYLREGLQMGEKDYSRSLGLITSSHQDMGCSNSQREMVPSTPNSSVSSSSSEGQVNPTNSNQGHQPTGSCSSSSIIAEEPPPEAPPASKKQTRKKGQKRSREPRFAFMTKSQVDHLEDGYRWRKYGQKAVKNSPYPRSYYRCTNSKCSVKKRVERSCEDPEIVITTYEGQHCHHSPASMLRGAPPPLHHLTSHLSTEFQQHQQDLQILMSTQHRTLDNNDNANNPYSSLAPTMEMNNNIYRELASQYISQRLLSSQQSVMMPTPSADMVGSGPPHSSSAHNGLTQSHLNTRGTGPLTRGLPPSMDHGLLEDILKRM